MQSRGHSKDRWLLSYADFITLLFAVFVLMYATAKAKEGHVTVPAVAHEKASTAITQAPPPPPPPAPRPSNLLTDLKTNLQLEQQNALLTVTVERHGIVIALDDKVCFGPGSADIQAAAVPMFAKVAGVLARYDSRILLQGHTDSTPIHNNRFGSNWELSTARSIAVMQLMQGRGSLRPDRFLIGGSADNTPVSSNETEGGRAHNRRVEIVVLDDAGSGDSFSVASR
jgi:chemotaxis protein MotB